MNALLSPIPFVRLSWNRLMDKPILLIYLLPFHPFNTTKQTFYFYLTEDCSYKFYILKTLKKINPS